MTYSMSITGASANNQFQPLVVKVSDQVEAGGQTLTAVGAPAEQNMMRLGVPVLCTAPHGGQAWYVYDAERSIPGVSRIMRRL